MERNEIINIINKCEEKCINEFKKVDNLEFLYSNKVLEAFQKNNVSEGCFNSTTGFPFHYIYNDPNTFEKYFRPCYDTCQTCFAGGTRSINNCNTWYMCIY